MVLGFPPGAPGPKSGWRMASSWVFTMAAFACALVGGVLGAARAGEQEPGYALKAGYLAKFTPFVDWPEGAFEAPGSPFRLCIGGHDPFGAAIDREAGGLRVGDHPVTVIRLPTVAKAAGCHLLFLSASRLQTPHQMLASVGGKPILTVADEDLEASGAMIQFVTVDSRLRFSIRAEMAQAAGLTLSSKLLALSAPREGTR